jgi:hypothetical protein
VLRALDASDRIVRDAALRAILHRNHLLAKEEVLRRWKHLPEHSRQIIAERPGWLVPALKSAVLGFDSALGEAACDAALVVHELEAIPALAAAAVDGGNPVADRAATTLVALAEILHDALAAPRDYRDRRDPQQLRAFVLPALERELTNPENRCRPEIFQAFVLLAARDNALLRHILQTPLDRNFVPLVDVLATSSRPGIIRQLIGFLDDPSAPVGAVQLLGRRSDITFLRQLFRRIGSDPAKPVRNNLRRISRCDWLTQGLGMLEAINEAEQAGAVNFAAHAGVERGQALEALAVILRRGGTVARRVAAHALEEFLGTEADELCLLASQDHDAFVRAGVAGQLRRRGVTGGIQRLLEMVDSDSEVERQAARKALEEFSFDRFVLAFDGLSPEVRRTTGSLVKRIDPTALRRLAEDLVAEGRHRREQALHIAVAMDAVGELHRDISNLLTDEDQYLRAEAVRALGTFDIPETRQALRHALLDSSPLVQDAAERVLQQLRLARDDWNDAAFPQVDFGTGGSGPSAQHADP